LPPTKTCAECGGQYAKGRYRYCSEPCSERACRRMSLVRYGKTPDEVDRCRKCGISVPMKRKSCDSCRAVALQNAKRRARRRRRARQRGAVCEGYTLAEIAERDRYYCGLCRKRVAMTKSVPHPKSPTIDHVLPLAVGGQDTRANVQLAHFECNWRKADRGTQQLALIG
jgi:5-methylcytosine-specific restriction endonuclease McrA